MMVKNKKSSTLVRCILRREEKRWWTLTLQRYEKYLERPNFLEEKWGRGAKKVPPWYAVLWEAWRILMLQRYEKNLERPNFLEEDIVETVGN